MSVAQFNAGKMSIRSRLERQSERPEMQVEESSLYYI